MARIRTIKPELWTDSDFVERSSNARLLFIAALNFASDFGVMADKPIELKMQCFPGDDVNVTPLIDELVGCRLWLRRVAPDGSKVLVIRTFCQHQRVEKANPGRWGDPNKWPEFDDHSPNDRRTIDDHSPPEGKGMEGNKDTRAETPPTDEPEPSSPPTSAEFNQWWLAYPRKVAKADARKAWTGIKPPKPDIGAQLAALKRLDGIESKFIPYPASWLRDRRWEDEPDTANDAPIWDAEQGVFMSKYFQ